MRWGQNSLNLYAYILHTFYEILEPALDVKWWQSLDPRPNIHKFPLILKIQAGQRNFDNTKSTI